MPDQEFKLLITGDASSATDAARKAGDATVDLDNKIKKLKERTGESAEKFEASERELRKLGAELSNVTGVAGLGEVFIGKLGAAMIGAGLSVELLKKAWEETKATINGPINIAVHDDVAKIEAAAKAWDQYAEARRKAAEAANSPGAQADRDIKDLQDKLKLLQEVLKAEEQEALAALATHEGQMSPEAYAAAQAAVRTRFGQKGTAATEQERRDEIARKEKEAADLEASSAQKKAEGESMSTGNADAQAAAKANAEKAKESLKELDERIALIRRYTAGFINGAPIGEYEGSYGKIQEAGDISIFYGRYGISSPRDAMAIEQQRRAQALAAVAQGERAGTQAEDRSKRKAELLSQAGEESAEAEKIRKQVEAEKNAAKANADTATGTDAISAATAAIGREHAAEGNNTPQGFRDAIAALNAGSAAASQVRGAIQTVGNTNKELHDALLKALLDVAAENKRLAEIVRQQSFNNH